MIIWNENDKYMKMKRTKCSCPGGGIGTRASLAANSFTLSSMSDKRQVFSWIKRLERKQAEPDKRKSEINLFLTVPFCATTPARLLFLSQKIKKKWARSKLKAELSLLEN